jgi:hypothetical protein
MKLTSGQEIKSSKTRVKAVPGTASYACDVIWGNFIKVSDDVIQMVQLRQNIRRCYSYISNNSIYPGMLIMWYNYAHILYLAMLLICFNYVPISSDVNHMIQLRPYIQRCYSYGSITAIYPAMLFIWFNCVNISSDVIHMVQFRKYI